MRTRLPIIITLCLCALLAWQWQLSARRIALLQEQLRTEQNLSAQLADSYDSEAAKSRKLEAERLSLQNTTVLEAREDAWAKSVQNELTSIRTSYTGRSLKPSRPFPPTSQKFGDIFPELLSDPEYHRLMRAHRRENLVQARVAGYGNSPAYDYKKLPAEIQGRALELLVDKEMVQLEIAGIQLEKDSADTRSGLNSYELIRSEEARIMEEFRSLAGEGAYKEYQESEARKMDLSSSAYANNVITRLSYSDTPLSEAQTRAILEFIPKMAPQSVRYSETIKELMKYCETSLLPAQVAELREMKTEEEAYEKRRKLPPADRPRAK